MNECRPVISSLSPFGKSRVLVSASPSGKSSRSMNIPRIISNGKLPVIPDVAKLAVNTPLLSHPLSYIPWLAFSAVVGLTNGIAINYIRNWNVTERNWDGVTDGLTTPQLLKKLSEQNLKRFTSDFFFFHLDYVLKWQHLGHTGLCQMLCYNFSAVSFMLSTWLPETVKSWTTWIRGWSCISAGSWFLRDDSMHSHETWNSTFPLILGFFIQLRILWFPGPPAQWRPCP